MSNCLEGCAYNGPHTGPCLNAIGDRLPVKVPSNTEVPDPLVESIRADLQKMVAEPLTARALATISRYCGSAGALLQTRATSNTKLRASDAAENIAGMPGTISLDGVPDAQMMQGARHCVRGDAAPMTLIVMDGVDCFPVTGQPGLFYARGEHKVCVDPADLVLLEEILVVEWGGIPQHRRRVGEEGPHICRVRLRGAPDVSVFLYGTFRDVLSALGRP